MAVAVAIFILFSCILTDMRKIVLLFAALFCGLSMFAQLQSPEQFLGYAPGTHFTPHYQIVNYFQYIARTVPDMVKLEQYGKTNEGRPLLLATIASKENFLSLENIRQNNLRLANMSRDKMAPNESTPAIVWLSFNVHGNEPASSEASMMTLYALVDPSNTNTKNWLKNTVVLIDPCINPDGRDRYVNWYNQMVGSNLNANQFAREHQEPWPRGRTNHYYFDLNRDWAWQTQLETRQRMVKYNEWMPQVHVDYHEQGYNAPYYFAPAAEPFHEVVSPWQREFQTTIGKNNAKYFDENGWLYFTKERFDLFYPSYGDTYPTYNGAIGMTFEQGGISAGLGVATLDGDTLFLTDRVKHHFTTSMSVVEITSLNATKVVHEYRNYFNNAVAKPAGEFKSYLLRADEGDRLKRLTNLLDLNKIDWGYANSGTAFAGMNYDNGKTENGKTAPGDVVVNMNQPKSNLIKVLFERSSKLSDSATYDITAWAVPFAYGLKAYAVKDFIASSKTAPTTTMNPVADNSYGFVVRWNGVSSTKFLASVLKQGVHARYTETAFTSGGKEYDKGTILITRAANQHVSKLVDIVRDAAASSGASISSITSGFVEKGSDVGSDHVHGIRTPRIALLSGDETSAAAVGEIWHFIDQELKYPVTLLNSSTLGRVNLNDYQVLVIPDGNYDFFGDKEQNEMLKMWVRRGGRIIALENAVAQMSRTDWGIKMKTTPEEKKDDSKKADYTLLKKFENRERDALVSSIPGAIYKVDLDNTHPLGFGYPDFYYTLKQDANIYEFVGDGWNVGTLRKDNYVTGFTGSKTKETLKDGLIFGVVELGAGQVVFLNDNPLFRNFWDNGKLLFCNALFLVGQ
jgi:Zinc carboxypeptidase